MHSPTTIQRRSILLLAAIGITFASPAPARAASVTPLHTFDAVTAPPNQPDPNSLNSLVQGSDGSLYGLTYFGGANNAGTVFKLTPTGSYTVLHDFSALANVDSSGRGTNADGAYPLNTLTPGGDGSFYGITAGGGGKYGTFYKITPGGVFTTLYSYSSTDPTTGIHQLVRGTDGNFYGTTGSSSYAGSIAGVMFRFTPGGVLTIPHSFNGLGSTYTNVNDGGASPNDLTLGSDGNFYGTTPVGGTNGSGTVFKITSDGTLTTLYNFNPFQTATGVTGVNNGGGRPIGALLQGSDGNFYGTTSQGTSYGRGNLFKITPGGTITRLYSFGSPSQGQTYDDGGFPQGKLVQGSDGNFYGTAALGKNLAGVIFELSSAGNYSVLYNYDSSSNTNGVPPDTFVEGSKGVFYGQGESGGMKGADVVIQLDLHPDFFAGELALGSEIYYLAFPGSGKVFGYYAFLSDSHYIYHFDLGYEYVFDAADGHGGVYLYDFKSGHFFYTSSTFPFPYLYDFSLQAFLYYFPDPTNPQRYNTNGERIFYNFSTRQNITL